MRVIIVVLTILTFLASLLGCVGPTVLEGYHSRSWHKARSELPIVARNVHDLYVKGYDRIGPIYVKGNDITKAQEEAMQRGADGVFIRDIIFYRWKWDYGGGGGSLPPHVADAVGIAVREEWKKSGSKSKPSKAPPMEHKPAMEVEIYSYVGDSVARRGLSRCYHTAENMQTRLHEVGTPDDKEVFSAQPIPWFESFAQYYCDQDHLRYYLERPLPAELNSREKEKITYTLSRLLWLVDAWSREWLEGYEDFDMKLFRKVRRPSRVPMPYYQAAEWIQLVQLLKGTRAGSLRVRRRQDFAWVLNRSKSLHGDVSGSRVWADVANKPTSRELKPWEHQCLLKEILRLSAP
jgi:hypothetical protein